MRENVLLHSSQSTESREDTADRAIQDSDRELLLSLMNLPKKSQTYKGGYI